MHKTCCFQFDVYSLQISIDLNTENDINGKGTAHLQQKVVFFAFCKIDNYKNIM